MTSRHSDLALVLAKLDVDGEVCLLLNRHKKWGDWSLVGGHVEPGEEQDWAITARREATEELAPLAPERDFLVATQAVAHHKWGPVPSRSAGHVPTTYEARYHCLKFLADPQSCLARLPAEDFVLVPLDELEHRTSDLQISEVVKHLIEAGRLLQALPLSSDRALHRVDIAIPVLRATHATPPSSSSPMVRSDSGPTSAAASSAKPRT